MGSILGFWEEFNLEISSGALVGFSERSTEGFPEKELTEKKQKELLEGFDRKILGEFPGGFNIKILEDYQEKQHAEGFAG